MKGPMILSTHASEYFAALIARRFGSAEFITTTRDRFGGGERYFRLDVDNRMALFGKDVVFVGSTWTDDDFIELCRVGTAAAKYGARRITYVIPFCGYTTMERAVKPGEIVTAKINARALSQLPQGDMRNCFLFLDLHTSGFVHYFEGECLRFELYAESVLTEAIRELGLSNFMFGSADLSRALWVETFARKFNTSLAFSRKSRDFEKTEVEGVVGDVASKVVVIYDDMIRSAGTLIHAAEAYRSRGATKIYAVTSHLALNNERVIDLLLASPIEKVVATNSHPMSEHERVKNSSMFIVKDVSHLFADAIIALSGGNS